MTEKAKEIIDSVPKLMRGTLVNFYDFKRIVEQLCEENEPSEYIGQKDEELVQRISEIIENFTSLEMFTDGDFTEASTEIVKLMKSSGCLPLNVKDEYLVRAIYNTMKEFAPLEKIDIDDFWNVSEAIIGLTSSSRCKENDTKMIDWLQSIMTPKDSYCEVFFAGLRSGDSDAISFQIESNPEQFPVLYGKDVRECIMMAMRSYPVKGNTLCETIDVISNAEKQMNHENK